MLEILVLTAFPALIAYAAASDLFTMTIPNRVSLALVVAFAAVALLGGLGWQAIALHAAAGILVLAIGFGMFSFGWIGGGDAKIAAATALWLGFGSLPEYLLIATVAGGLLSVAILSLRVSYLPAFAMGWAWLARLHDRKSGVPYGIALSAAALLVYPQSAVWRAVLAA